MEPKKNPKYDIHRKRGIIFNISLIVSLTLVISAFQWAVPKKNPPLPPLPSHSEAEVYIVPITSHDHNREAASKPKQAVVTKSVPVTIITEVDDHLKDVVNTLGSFDQLDTSMVVASVEIPVEDANTTFESFAVEKKPEPIGGFNGFQQLLIENLKYPRRAIQNETQGKVYVSFTVSKTGAVNDLNVLKGIGDGCDEEAMRVIALSKWMPGKQRGIPVAVRMVQPVVFSLNKN